MIRKLFSATLLVAAMAASGALSLQAQPLDRDMLLTPNGTLFTIESDFSANYPIDTASGKVLHFGWQHGTKFSTMFVPASLTGGINTDPSLAYDSDSDTLFVFWQRSPNTTRLSTELLFCSYHDGMFSEPTSIDVATMNIRYNLKIAITHWASDRNEDGQITRSRALIAHLVWWEQTGYGEEAHYAMLTLNKGQVLTPITTQRLLDYVPSEKLGAPTQLAVDFDRDFLRHPAITENASHDGVELVFANWDTNNFEHVGIRPIKAEGVIRVPGGVWLGERHGPKNPIIGVESAKSSVMLSPGGSLAFYSQNEDGLHYVVSRSDDWSDERTIKLNSTITADAAIDAVRRLVASE